MKTKKAAKTAVKRPKPKVDKLSMKDLASSLQKKVKVLEVKVKYQGADAETWAKLAAEKEGFLNQTRAALKLIVDENNGQAESTTTDDTHAAVVSTRALRDQLTGALAKVASLTRDLEAATAPESTMFGGGNSSNPPDRPGQA